MTVQTTTIKQFYAGGQSVLPFSFSALTSDPQYIQVALVTLATSQSTSLIYGTDYTVVVNSSGVGGTVTIIDSPTWGTGYNFVVYRSTAAVQASAYSDYNSFPASTLEDNLDQLTMVDQEIQEATGRTLSYPISAPTNSSTLLPVPVANAFLQWNSSANAIVNAVLPSPGNLILASTTQSQQCTDNSGNYFMSPYGVGLAIAALVPPTTATTTILQAVYPVGGCYISTVSTNPATVFGFGTWSQIAQGQCLVGVGTGTDQNSVQKAFTAGTNNGEYAHTQTTNELVPHTHTGQLNGSPQSGNSTVCADQSGGQGPITYTTNSTGGGVAFNVTNPTFGVDIFKRLT